MGKISKQSNPTAGGKGIKMCNSPVPGVNPGSGKCTFQASDVLKAEGLLGKSNLSTLMMSLRDSCVMIVTEFRRRKLETHNSDFKISGGREERSSLGQLFQC